jgi:hypothetical protein
MRRCLMRTTLDLPDPLFRRLKSHAALQGKTLRELFLEMTERMLAAGPVSTPEAPTPHAPTPMGRRHTDFVD